MKPKPKPMKPVKAWAYVDEATGKLNAVAQIGYSKKRAEQYRNHYERLARVEIREVLKNAR